MIEVPFWLYQLENLLFFVVVYLFYRDLKKTLNKIKREVS